MTAAALRVCSRCLYDSSIPGIVFDARGECSYCNLHDEMERQYPLGADGDAALARMVNQMREAGRGKPFDCVVGVSGGCDSSFLLYKMVKLGLRPLAVHFDNTWNSPIATQNIYNVLDALGVQLETIVVNSKEYDDLYRSFLLAGVRDIEAPTDIGLAATLYLAAEKYGIKYIVEGHSFRTEGISPLGWLYMDGKYIESVHKRFGTRPLRTFPNLTLARFLRWASVRGIRRLRPLYHIDYRKEATKEFLTRELGWQWYGGHHLENRFTAFYHAYFMPKRWGIDARLLGYSALTRSGQMDRGEAARLMATPPVVEPEILALVKKRLGFSEDEFEAVMEAPKHHYTEFETYKQTFERLRPVFWLLYKLDRLPKSFYVKFTRSDSSGTLAKVPADRESVLAPNPSLHRAD